MEQSCKGLQIYCIKYGQISMVVEQTWSNKAVKYVKIISSLPEKKPNIFYCPGQCRHKQG